MKKIAYSLLMVSLLTGCYEDKGNYDYNFDRMNEITDIAFRPAAIETLSGKTIELQQPLTEAESLQRVEVSLEQSLTQDMEQLDFFWIRSYRNAENEKMKDTIETKGYLDVQLPVGRSMEYKVLLKIRDRSTSLEKYANFIIKTRPIFKNSLFVLHGNMGARKLGNIEVVGDETKVRLDAFEAIASNHGANFTNALGLSYTTYFDYSQNKGKISNNLCLYTSTGEAAVYEPFGLSYKFTPKFVLPSTDIVYGRYVETGDTYVTGEEGYYHMVLSTDGKFYTGNALAKLYKPGKGIELYGGDPNHQTDYQVTAGTITYTRFVLWDAKHNRFLYLSKLNDSYANNEYYTQNPYLMLNNPVLDAQVDLSKLAAEMSPVGKKAVYAYVPYRENYREAHAYFIFKDEAAGSFYLYDLTPISSGDEKGKGDDGGGSEAGPAFNISAKVLRNFDPGQLGTVTYNAYFTTNYLFYANGGCVYRYNASNGDRTILYTAPAGYEVSLIKFRVNNKINYSGDLGYIMSIGLSKGNEGAVAEIKLTTSSDVDEDFGTLFYDRDASGNRFGRIQDVQFAHEYGYRLPALPEQ